MAATAPEQNPPPAGGVIPPDGAAQDPPCVARAVGADYADGLGDLDPWPAFVSRVPIAYARTRGVMGLLNSSGRPLMALTDLADWQQLDVIGRLLGRRPEPLFAPRPAILAAINALYQRREGQAEAAIRSIDAGDGRGVGGGGGDLRGVLDEVESLAGREDLLDVAGRAPVIRLVNLVLFEAIRAGASDVHLQPAEDRLVVRLRVDGVLYAAFDLPKGVQEEAVGRLKVMGRMNVAEKRLPQDGRATAQVGDRTVDLRIATLPSSHGERVVVRLLDKGARLYRLPELGMDPAALGAFRRLAGREHGILLVTGPTGSGKSTTLYGVLQEIDCERRNVITLEDPIEYRLDGVSQTQVSDRKGMTFASGLRSVLRQDPDVIMVGEVRDRETATMAIQSALTGHLVFSTLHTNDAATAVTRLLDLGIEPYLVASSVAGVLAQRLVRRVCPACGVAADPTAEERRWLADNGGGEGGVMDTSLMRRGPGCEGCRQTGYRGRVGVFELLALDGRVRRLVHERAPAAQIKAAAVAAGMGTLGEDGRRKVLAGVTTVAEVERVAGQAGDAFEEPA